MLRWLFPVICAASLTFSSFGAVVFPADAEWNYLPGRSEASPTQIDAWRGRDFDDSSWQTGKGPFYYEDQPGSGNAFTGNTRLADMRGSYSSVFLRKSFDVASPSDIRELELTAISDDGFIAWLNGAEVARFNMPNGEPRYNGVSLGARSEPLPVLKIVIDQPGERLVAGANVLAVQAFNSGLGNSTDFLISVALASSVDDQPPTVKYLIPTANALVRALTQIEVGFAEDVAGVDATDLLINGQPAASVTALNDSQYVFEFPQPASGKVSVTWSSTHGIRDLASAANPFGGGAWNYTLDPNAAPPGLMISEFVADNKKSLRDEDGDGSDWIEVFNAGSTPVSLNGYYLTVQSNVTQWRFPNVSVLPNDYRIVFASGKNRTAATAQLHTNFKLDKAGGYLALLDPAGKVISEIVGYPPQFEDVSYGRERANPNLLGYFPQPTPGEANTVGGQGFSPDVEFSRSGGTFNDPFALVLTTGSPGATIRYTLDGSLPTETSAIYATPIQITETVQVRAASYSPDLLPSRPRSESFIALQSDARSFTSDLPVVVIHNFGAGSVPGTVRQFAHISVYEPGFGRTSLTNRPTVSTRAGINLRGSSTRGLPKSSFRVEFWNEFDEDARYPLLGMPAEADWVLYACNNFEPVLIHNKYMHDLSRDIGRYSPRARFVEVYVNTSGGPLTAANYNGVYVLLEKIKQGSDRVAVDELRPGQTQPPQVTGGYVLSVDRSAPGEGQIFASRLGINTLSPQWEELSQPERAPQFDYITQYLDTVYDVLNSANFADPVNGYAKYIDVPAAIDHHILNVLAFNVDALRLSGYFYKPREGKLTMGPLWDFDRALGSTDGRDSNPRVWRSTSGDQGTDMFNAAQIFSNPWYSRMFRDLEFWQRWIDRWQELRRSEFALTNLHGLVESLANQVREAERREVARWPNLTSPRGGSYQAEVDRLKTWLSNRVDFIDTNFLAAPVLSSAGGPLIPGSSLTIAGPAGASLYYTLDGTDPRAPGGALSSSALPYTGPIALTGNARVVARARDLNHFNLTGANRPPLSSPWSGSVAATFIASTPALAVTELMYHPAPSAPGADDGENYEFIELKNTGSQTLSLIGFHFTRGIDYAFTAGSGVTTLAPGEYVLLVKNRAAFAQRYPNATRIAGEYVGSLANGGERLTLAGPLEEPVADFTYENHWYPSTDGAGFSLVVASEEQGPGSTAGAWRFSSSIQGSPGRQDAASAAFPTVVVNEALTHTDPPAVDAIELWNASSSPADVGGWFLTDDLDAPAKFAIPSGTVIPAGGFAVFDETQFNAAGKGFALSALGDQVYLFSGDGRVPTGYAHGFDFGAAANGVTFGRHVNSLGEQNFVSQTQSTLGQPNAGPKVGPGLMTEIMFEPPPLAGANNTRDEFIEIANSSSQSLPLFDPNAPTNTWKLGGGVEFTFPQNLTLGPGQALLVVAFNPQTDATALAAFNAQYRIGPSGPLLVGPFTGNLNNSADHITLLQPDPPQPAGSADAGFVPYVLVEEIHYDVRSAGQSPWPTGASGTGLSFQRRSATQFADEPLSWQAAAPTPGSYSAGNSADADQDGLPDDWERAHGLDPSSAAGDNGALGDPDADGATNQTEYLAGTHPREAASVLRFTAIEVNASGAALRFAAAPGKAYSIEYRDALSPGPWQKLADIPASAAGGPIAAPDPTLGSVSSRFYRLVVH